MHATHEVSVVKKIRKSLLLFFRDFLSRVEKSQKLKKNSYEKSHNIHEGNSDTP